MMIGRKIIRAGGAIVFLIGLQACTIPHFQVAVANQQSQRGEFQNAIIGYSEVLNTDTEKQYDHWLTYNLGNVFFALGEYESSALEWEKSSDTESSRLEFNLLFNRGVMHYRLGEYEKAYLSFKEALEIEPESTAAKINLEYALEKFEAGKNGERGTASTGSRDRGEATDSEKQSVERILEYVRRKETGVWKSAEQQDTEKRVNDW